MNSATPPGRPGDLLAHAFDLADRQRADPGTSATSAGLQRICRAVVSDLPLLAAAVRLVPAADQELVVALSAPAARAIADLSFAVGEGPVRDAFATRRPVLAGDLAARLERWPGYVSQALELGVRATYAVPLQLGATCFGVLGLHADRPDALDETDLPTALAFAQAAALTVLEAIDGWAIVEDDHTARFGTADRGPAAAFDHRPEIHQAQGMVMVDLAIAPSEALLRMRARAFGTGETLTALSRRIIAGDEDPRAWVADPPNDHQDGAPGL